MEFSLHPVSPPLGWGKFSSNTPQNPELRQVAEQFEALFINHILQQSRQSKLAEDIFGSSQLSTYQQLLDQEYSENISSHINLGIANALMRQFQGQTE